jgi:hypothetical protein
MRLGVGTKIYCYTRNLCIDGGYDICAEMYNKSILVPLRTFVPKVQSLHCTRCAQVNRNQVSTTLSQYLEGAQNAPENAQTLVYEFSDNLITVLWCLSWVLPLRTFTWPN